MQNCNNGSGNNARPPGIGIIFNYLESSPGYDGDLLICKDPPENPEYKLASPVSISTDLTIDQNMVHFHSVLMRLPVLSVD